MTGSLVSTGSFAVVSCSCIAVSVLVPDESHEYSIIEHNRIANSCRLYVMTDVLEGENFGEGLHNHQNPMGAKLFQISCLQRPKNETIGFPYRLK